MSIHQTYAVFGLGRYGMAVARELVNNGMEVIAVDENIEAFLQSGMKNNHKCLALSKNIRYLCTMNGKDRNYLGKR